MLLYLLASLVLASTTDGASVKFFKNYHATGYVSLPYAEIKEPFEAWYSSSLNKSRIDFWGGMVKNVIDVSGRGMYKIAPMTNDKVTNSPTCFKTDVDAGDDIEPQSLLPDGSLFVEAGTELVNGFMCNKWVYKNTANNTHIDQTYTLYIYGDSFPMKFVMKGYNIISGSHIDEYIIDYTTFTQADDMSPAVFSAPYKGLDCGGYPGPGLAGIEDDIFADIISGKNNHHDKFEDFKSKHDKKYSTKEEHSNKFAAFVNNVRYIDSMNRKGLGYRLGVNHMADWLPNQHIRTRGKIYTGEKNNGKPFVVTEQMKLKELPENLDLRLEGAVGPVKDQAICGSCWSFATTGSIEGAFFKKYGYKVSVSEQNLMDCSWGYGNNGCDGGEEWRAYEWMLAHGGIAHEEEYGPYLMADGYCHSEKAPSRVEITGYVNVTSGSEEALKLALFTFGPVAVNIDASHKSLSFYESGVYSEPACKNGPEDLDHAVLAVGWGTLGGKPYWIVKNSWSTHWGNVGYVLMSRTDNNCGVATDATYVEIK